MAGRFYGWVLAGLTVWLVASPALAQTQGSWRLIEAPLVSPDSAWTYFETQQSAPSPVSSAGASISTFGTLSVSAASVSAASSAEVTADIQELAIGLKGDPQAIFDYVRNNIEFTPYFGSRKGATLTLLEGAGNDFDQASLLKALLTAAGHEAHYVFGWMRMPNSELASWLGVDNDNAVISSVLGLAGMPATVGQISTEVTRVWVVAVVGGTTHYLDPAFKQHQSLAPVDLLASTGYTRADFLAAVTAGATITADSARSLSESGLSSKLTQYSTNLATALRRDHANKSLADLLGTPRLVPATLPLASTIPFQNVAQAVYAEFPDAFTAMLRVQFQGIDYSMKLRDSGGKRLTITFVGGDNHPELRLNGTLLAAGHPTIRGGSYSGSVTVNHPYSAFNGTYGDQTEAFGAFSGGTYTFIANLGGTSQAVIKSARRTLDELVAQGLPHSSEAVLGQSLLLLGVNWMQQFVAAGNLVANLNRSAYIAHHCFGFMGQDQSYYISVYGWSGSLRSRAAGSTASFPRAVFDAWGNLNSAFEHGVLESLVGRDKPGVSTIKLLQLQNASGGRNYKVTQSNFAQVRPALASTYSSAFLNEMSAVVQTGAFFIIPENGRLVVSRWTGQGYFQSNKGWLISGNLFGGYGTCLCTVDPRTVQSRANIVDELADLKLERSLDQKAVSADPVDLYSGAWVFDHVDLSIGSVAPRGLAFKRSYSSGLNASARSLGYGWSHSYDWYIRRTGDLSLAYGARQPIDAVAALVYFQVATDLIANDDLTNRLTSMLAAKWFVDYLLDDAVIVNRGTSATTYMKLPDGSYAAPPGSTTSLTLRADNTFKLQERHGAGVSFDTSDRASTVQDADGNTLTISYASGRVQTIADAYGRTLTLAYSGDRLQSVSDSAGRSVSYGFDGSGNLTSFTDPEGFAWTYDYDGSHRVVRARNPVGVVTVTNEYDGLGRVMRQLFPRQGAAAEYTFFYGGDRTTEADFDGHETTTFFDHAGRVVREVDATGATSVTVYDAQGHIVSETDPRGNVRHLEYDADHNLVRSIDALNQASTATYDEQFRNITSINPLKQTTTQGYDAEHHVTSTQNAAGGLRTVVYRTDGLPLTVTSNGVTTAYTYDASGNVATTQIGQHPPTTYEYDAAGRLSKVTDQVGAVTRASYDRRGLVTSNQDPLGRSSTSFYDAAGRRLSATDRSGATLQFLYTATDKIRRVTYPGGVLEYSYDRHDRLTSVVGPLGVNLYTYDAVGRVTRLVDHRGFALAFEYDAAGNLTAMTYPGDKVVRYDYDQSNRLTRVRNWLGQTATYAYDAGGRMTELVQFNNIRTTYAYDAVGRLTAQSTTGAAGALASYVLQVDAAGNRTGIDRSEFLQLVDGARTVDYAFNATRNRLLSAGATTYSFDLEGRLNAAGATTFSFNALHQLTAAGPATFVYDAFGQRVEANRAGTVTRYVYDVAGNVVAEADASNVITRYYVYGQGLLAAITPANDTYSYLFDPSGNTVALTSSSQQVLNRYAYEPFGAIADQLEAVPQPFKFVGDRGVVAEGGTLYYMRARYYDAAVGRFISEDPKGAAGGDLNLYTYVGNNPLGMSDSSGRSPDAGRGSAASTGGGVNTILPAVPSWVDTAVSVATYAAIGVGVAALATAAVASAPVAATAMAVAATAGEVGAYVAVIDFKIAGYKVARGDISIEEYGFKLGTFIAGNTLSGAADAGMLTNGKQLSFGFDLGSQAASDVRGGTTGPDPWAGMAPVPRSSLGLTIPRSKIF